MTTVQELVPGDEVTLVNTSATFVAQTIHPIWATLRLVIWRMADGSWSHDALDARQDVGRVTPTTKVERMARLRVALLGNLS